MTTRKKVGPTEMEKALKLIDRQIAQLQKEIEMKAAQIQALYVLKDGFEKLQASSQPPIRRSESVRKENAA